MARLKQHLHLCVWFIQLIPQERMSHFKGTGSRCGGWDFWVNSKAAGTVSPVPLTWTELYCYEKEKEEDDIQPNIVLTD